MKRLMTMKNPMSPLSIEFYIDYDGEIYSRTYKGISNCEERIILGVNLETFLKETILISNPMKVAKFIFSELKKLERDSSYN